MTEGLKKAAEKRRQDVLKRVRAAQEAIEREIEAEDGIYPQNKGKLTFREFLRRASLSISALQGPAHKDSTLPEVQAWLKNVQKAVIQGRKNVRKTITDRANNWKIAWEQIANQWSIAELEYRHQAEELRESRAEVEKLRRERDELRVLVSVQKVVPLNRDRE